MRPHNTVIVMVVGVGLAILLVLGWQRYNDRRHDPSRQARMNLKLLSLTMHVYAAEHDGSFPPPAICSPDGTPLLSWRVALLPYLEQQALYDHFRLNEPWDSPHNIALLPKMPAVFELDADHRERAPNKTFFQVFVGPGAAFEERRGMTVKDFRDGTSNTILIIEAGQAVPWTAPEDLTYAPDGPLPALGAHGRKYFRFALADASVRWLPATTSSDVIRAAITRNGGEKIGLDDPAP